MGGGAEHSYAGMKKLLVLWFAVMAVNLLLYAWFVWPTPWEYGYVQKESMLMGKDGKYPWVTFPARTNRLTGEKQIQHSDGEWDPDFVW